jgi:glycosyltransferase involved in cell wall biosynthesis
VPPALEPVAARAPRTYEAPLDALLVANVIPRKGVLPLLEALAASADAPPFSLRIVGRHDMDPAYAAACRSVVGRSPSLSERVRFDGAVPHERMAALYHSADVLVSASAMETFGMAIHEARARGLPVIAVQGGYSLRHFEDGENGLACSSAFEAATELVALARDELRMALLFARAQATRASSERSWADEARQFLDALARAGA